MDNGFEQALSQYVKDEKTRNIILQQIKDGFSGDFGKFSSSGANPELMEYIGKMVRLHKTIKKIKKQIAEKSKAGAGMPGGDEETKKAIMEKVKTIMGIDFAQYYQQHATSSENDELKEYIAKMIRMHKNIKKIKEKIGGKIEKHTA